MDSHFNGNNREESGNDKEFDSSNPQINGSDKSDLYKIQIQRHKENRKRE